MDIRVAKKIALSKMKELGLNDWSFKFDNAKSRLGLCSHSKKTIQVSRLYAKLNDESRIVNTILHEIAHALVGSSHGHNDVWRNKAIALGSDGERCASGVELVKPKPKYIGTCPNCGKTIYKNRMRSTTGACNICCNKLAGGSWDARFRFDWKENK